ncbi:MAG TPA: hypothetical protein VLT36_10030 [Candidatus Dormibacteraeota bacterium]|nr:hypothetical protein [Candidatus Dormibacteraeota bacterium]
MAAGITLHYLLKVGRFLAGKSIDETEKLLTEKWEVKRGGVAEK